MKVKTEIGKFANPYINILETINNLRTFTLGESNWKA